MDHLIDDSDRQPQMPPYGHPLRTLGDRLGSLLDEDQWAECERLLVAGWDQDRIDRETGAAWRQNNSLEVWFPLTAEGLLKPWERARFGVFLPDGRFEELPADDPVGEKHPQGHTARWVGGQSDMQLLRAALRALWPNAEPKP